MTPQVVLNIFNLSISRQILVYQGVHLAKDDFTEVAKVHISLYWSVLKGLHQEVTNSIINSIIL